VTNLSNKREEGREGEREGGRERTVRVAAGASEAKESLRMARSSLNSGAVRRMRFRV
jgi:hypothetical protein